MKTLAALAARIVAAITPAPGTTEGAVMVGLILVAAGCALAGQLPAALFIPGLVLVILGGLPSLWRR